MISADSRQLYRGFDIGTAKPTDREQLDMPHLGIDVLDPTERASAAWWADCADEWIRDVARSGRTPIVVGGTGLYLRALFGSLFEEPPLDADARASIQAALAPLETGELRRWVEALDPARAHLGRTQLQRAIEIPLLTGRRVSELHRENARPPRRRARYLLIDPGLSLQQNIAERAHTMTESGWVEEVRDLMRVVPADAPAWNAAGYGAIRNLVLGELTHDEAVERVIIETRQYAKRQRTWFRHQLAGEDVTPLSTDQADWPQRATAWWNGEAIA